MSLYFTGISNSGRYLMGGLYQFKSQHGIPYCTSLDLCKENHVEPDIFELLCHAWLDNCLGFESTSKELEMLGLVDQINKWMSLGSYWLSKHPRALKRENPVDVFCKYHINKKKVKRL